MKKLLHCFLAFITCASIASADPLNPKIAVMSGPKGAEYKTEFDFAMQNLGLSADYYECTTNGVKKLAENLNRYDLVMFCPLFNWTRDKGTFLPEGTLNKKAFLDFLNKGGVLVMTDASYWQPLKWLAELGPEFGGIKDGSCKDVDELHQVKYTYDAEVPHAIKFFPNKINQPCYWGHYLKPTANSKWRAVAYCQEDFPVMFTQDVGKGLVVLSVMRQPSAAHLENYFANAQMRHSGLKVKSFEMSPIQIGEGSVKIELETPVKEKTKLIFQVSDDKFHKQDFEAVFTGSTCEVDFKIEQRGPITVSLVVETAKGRTVAFTRNSVIPQLVTLNQSAYRGILSTKRRLPEVKFQVDVNPIHEDLTDTKLVLSLFDQCGNIIAAPAYEHDFSTNSIPNELLLSVPMSKMLTAGEYTLTVEIMKNGRPFNKESKAETKISILDPIPAQTIIDEDCTFLVNGEPFFPLGIYHAPPAVYGRLREMGLNSVQTWMWDLGRNKYGIFGTAAMATANGLKIVPELNHKFEHIILNNCRTLANDPAVLMWYTVDEPSEESYGHARMMRDTYHNNDINHPTYALSYRPHIFREQAKLASVFGHDPYGKPDKVAHWTKTAVDAVDNRKATVAVLSSFGGEPIVFRANAYTAIVNGARGVFWYPWSQMGGGPIGVGLNKHENLQEELTRVTGEIKKIESGILATTRRSFRINDDAVHGMVCGGKNDRNRYLIMVNITDKEVNVKHTIDELVKVKKVGNPFVDEKARNIEITDGVISKDFGPYEVLVYNW